MIRPENMKLSRAPLEGRMNAPLRIETIVNSGDNALVIGRAGETLLRVRVLGADVVILKEGDDCLLCWLPEAVRLVTH